MPAFAWALLGLQCFIGIIVAILIWVSMIRDMRIRMSAIGDVLFLATFGLGGALMAGAIWEIVLLVLFIGTYHRGRLGRGAILAPSSTVVIRRSKPPK